VGFFLVSLQKIEKGVLNDVERKLHPIKLGSRLDDDKKNTEGEKLVNKLIKSDFTVLITTGTNNRSQPGTYDSETGIFTPAEDISCSAYLQKDKNGYIIKGEGSDTRISYDIDQEKCTGLPLITWDDPPKPVLDTDGIPTFSPYHPWIGLAHEMGHASLHIEGRQHPNSTGRTAISVPPGEKQAIDIENKIRYEHKDEGVMKKYHSWKKFWELVDGNN